MLQQHANQNRSTQTTHNINTNNVKPMHPSTPNTHIEISASIPFYEASFLWVGGGVESAMVVPVSGVFPPKTTHIKI